MAEGLLNYTRLDDPDDVVCTTQGRPMSADDEVRLVDEFDQDVPDGRAGLAAHPRPLHPARLLPRRRSRTRAPSPPDGWYRSGDIVPPHADGNLIVEGRDKDMINRGGEKISAEEVENLVYRLPQVAQVAAVAMPDPELGERVCVYAVLRPGTDLTLDEVRDAMAAEGVARYKWPERLEVVEELRRPPRSARSTRRRCAPTSPTAGSTDVMTGSYADPSGAPFGSATMTTPDHR